MAQTLVYVDLSIQSFAKQVGIAKLNDTNALVHPAPTWYSAVPTTHETFLYFLAGVDNEPVVFLFTDKQIVVEGFVVLLRLHPREHARRDSLRCLRHAATTINIALLFIFKYM